MKRMKYVWMLTDSASDHEPPMLFSSLKKAKENLREMFEDTLNSYAYELTEEEKTVFREQFKKDGEMYFALYENQDNNDYRSSLLWARSCSITKEYIF